MSILLPTLSKNQNLYLPGLTPDGRPRTHVCIPGAWDHFQTDQQRGGPGELFVPELIGAIKQARKGPATLIIMDVLDLATARVQSRCITHNNITDLGAIAALGILSNNAPTPSTFLALDQSVANAAFDGSIAPGVQTAFVVTPTGPTGYTGGAPTFQVGNAASTFQSAVNNDGTKQNNNNVGVLSSLVGLDTTYGTGIVASFGTANAEGVAGSTTANSPSTIHITPYTTTRNHESGDWIIATHSVTDNPSTAPAGIQFSGVVTAVPTGIGIGNRSVALSYTWPMGALAPGQYSGGYLTTSSTPGSGIYYGVFSITPQNVSGQTGGNLVYIISL